MLTFSKQEFTDRLNSATVNLLRLAFAVKDDKEQTRLLNKRSAVEASLAWWFAYTVDLSDEEAYIRLGDLRETLLAKIRVGGLTPGSEEGLNLVLSYINEY